MIIIIIIIIITINNKIPKMGLTYIASVIVQTVKTVLSRMLYEPQRLLVINRPAGFFVLSVVAFSRYTQCLLMGLTLQRYSSILIGFIVKTVYLLRYLFSCLLFSRQRNAFCVVKCCHCTTIKTINARSCTLFLL